LPCRLDRCRQDRDQFVGFSHQGRELLAADDNFSVLDESQPVQRLAHLLVRHTDLVNEIGAALGAACFLVV
jgi:hypothetical protein